MCNRLSKSFSSGDKKCLLAVDNTFLGPVFQHPLKHGADLVVYSATKFISGHSDLIAGACVGSKNVIAGIKAMRTFLGSMLDPHSSWLVMRSLETLKIRMERQALSAIKVAEYVRSHPKVEIVHFLGFLEEGDAQKKIFENQCEGTGSMISFTIPGGEEEAFRFLDHLKLFKLAVSLGSTESLAEHPATMTHVDVSEEDRQRLGIHPNLVRLSIGLEDPEDLIAAIKEAFNHV
ncbi:PLP-dependent transferase [Marinilabilia salmonicolor]|nr:PLP-dependent transferase [Marinilabilia salmonicolor]